MLRARLLPSLALAVVLAGCAAAPSAIAAPPPIRHVFVIVLENKDAAKTFAADSPAPYLATTLRSQGVFVPGYYGIGHLSNPNYLAMVSGQAPNPQTQGDCQVFSDFLPGAPASDGQVVGQGCAYPASVKTVGDQLDAKGLSWKGYMQDMGADPAREPATCAHPAIGAQDKTQSATAKDQYATRHNPFVYFHSIIDDQARCSARDVPLDRLSADLGSAAGTPNYSFITPDLCADGHDATCADGGKGGLEAADAFLRTWVPRIVDSPAFQDGLLLITFDEAESDSSGCCGEQSGPNTPSAGGPEPGAGGGRIGAVALSPYIRAGSTSPEQYNHYGMLRSVEDLFGLDHLGYAGQSGLRAFGDDIYSNPAGSTRPAVTSSSASAPGRCRSVSLAGKGRRLAPRTLLASLRLRRTGGHRAVTLRATHYARVRLRSRGARTRSLLVQPCRTVTLRLGRGSRGRVGVTAATRTHAERRTLG
jgi:hypothetical protein